MHKRSIRILSLLMVLALLLTGCDIGTMTPGASKPKPGVEGTVNVTDPNEMDDDNPFTVSLTYEGKTYIPTADKPITIQWNDGYSVHTANLGEDGVARIGGLDGDYKVTMDPMPEGFVYNPNAYIATNDYRHIEIELQKVVAVESNTGLQLFDAIHIENTGVYCIEVTGEGVETFFEFAPTESGTYAVSSWMDTTTNEVNPTANYYGASFAYKPLVSTHDDGGPEGSYTKNFVMTVQIADEQISSNGTGSAVFTFGILATQKSGKYPIKVYIAITLDGGFGLNHTDAVMVLPQEELVQQPYYDPSRYTYVGAETVKSSGNATGKVFDADMYKLYPKEQGGDGYYHLYDEVTYASTNGYGPILYAKISQASRFLAALTEIEYAGNKALQISTEENYKMFIEGWEYMNWTAMTVPGEPVKPPYFCDLLCPCRTDATCASYAVTGKVGTCTEDCQKCLATCNKLPLESIGAKGYGEFTNSDGCYAVTEELKQFLQKFAIAQVLYMDGQGFAETHPTDQVYAAEEDQWLFACGYYLPK